MLYGYCRCSTSETKQDINRQVRELKALGVLKEDIFKEYVSGNKDDRCELNRLLSLIQEGDTIITTEVSRITRSTKQLCSLLDLAKNKKLKLIFGSFIVDCTKELDPMTQGMLQMMGVFAELEKNIISQRVKSGVANARAKGKQIGRPINNKVPKKIMDLQDLYLAGTITKKDYSIMAGVSRPTLDRYLEILEEKEYKN